MGVRTGTRTYLTGGDHASQPAGKQATSDERSTERLDTLSFWLAEEFGGVPYDERSGSWNPMVGPEDAPDPESIETAAPWYQEVQFDPALTDEQLERIEARALELGIDTEWPHEEWDQVYLEDVAAREADGGWDGWRRREWERFHPQTPGLLDSRERFLEHHEMTELLLAPARDFRDEVGSLVVDDDLLTQSYFETNGPRIARRLEEDFIAEQVVAGVGPEEALARALAVDFSELLAGSYEHFLEALRRTGQS